VHTSASGQNHSGFRSAQYDKLVADAKKELDPAKRVAIMHQAEDILMEEMPIMPLYYYVNVSAIKPNVKGVAKSQLGFVFFENAYLEK
jgi:oligopeptide transport system substrate-binding protein